MSLTLDATVVGVRRETVSVRALGDLEDSRIVCATDVEMVVNGERCVVRWPHGEDHPEIDSQWTLTLRKCG